MNEEMNVPVAEEENTIDLMEIARVLLQKAWLIILVAVIGALIAFGYTRLLVTPQYEASSKLYVLAKSTSVSSTFNYNLNQQLTQDVISIATTRPVLDEVIDELNLNADYDTLVKAVSVENITGSSILEISVTNPNAQLAADISNAIANEVADQIAIIMVTDRPSIMEEAVAAKNPVSPSVMRNVLMGAILGAVLVIGILIIRFIMDDTIKTTEDVQKRLGTVVLAAFPLEKTGKGKA